jgi:hypothetical protein
MILPPLVFPAHETFSLKSLTRDKHFSLFSQGWVKKVLEIFRQVVAVAARSLDTAKEFAQLHGIPKAYEGK